MDPYSRHQCLVYSGPPSRHLRPVAVTTRTMLSRGNRCIYLNSEPMVAGLRSCLAAEGVDVEEAIGKGALTLSSDQGHLVDGAFDIEAMLRTLESTLNETLADGFSGLWASGDMTWEFGPRRDFSTLLEYEWRLEDFLRTHPQMSGICQYHSDSLPREAMRAAVRTHQSIFVNETLSMVNPHYSRAQLAAKEGSQAAAFDGFVGRLLQLQENG